MEQGHITIDGIDIKNLDPSWLRGRAIGFINQVRPMSLSQISEKHVKFYQFTWQHFQISLKLFFRAMHKVLFLIFSGACLVCN